jgi:hypothetical protein
MLAQIRTYTINRGEIDSFLKEFQTIVIPLHEKVHIPIIATWIDRGRNEFIWVRRFEDQADRDRKLKVFQESPEMADIRSQVAIKIAKMDVRDVEGAFAS